MKPIMYLNQHKMETLPPFREFKISKSLKPGNLVTLRGIKAIRWSRGQKLYGVYAGEGKIFIEGVANVNPSQFKELIRPNKTK